MDDYFKTALISPARYMTAGRMKIKNDAVFHAGHGNNYTSGDFAEDPAPPRHEAARGKVPCLLGQCREWVLLRPTEETSD
ncbi:hypothetical protein [Streptomyces sp. ME19-01-6]|uniref:hypothetical protein n=1 Tax=Streptomyces sp. ME19-01-6 TaxID=3028686 RepID=UPI0029A09C71|nr:hypothetical protein [Streptomyces sp. ME19-01-6]MDX3224162.1 hypothetical protein [Streptomyces sp. ME19-01-6]